MMPYVARDIGPVLAQRLQAPRGRGVLCVRHRPRARRNETLPQQTDAAPGLPQPLLEVPSTVRVGLPHIACRGARIIRSSRGGFGRVVRLNRSTRPGL